MKNVRNYLTTLVTTLAAAVRPLMIATACALLVFSSAAPAFAFGKSPSKPSEGVVELDSVQNQSERAIAGPEGGVLGNPEAVKENAQKGLNGIQGTADVDNMSRPSNAEGKTIEENIKEALETVTP